MNPYSPELSQILQVPIVRLWDWVIILKIGLY